MMALAAIAFCSSAQGQLWSIGEQPFPVRISNLPLSRQKAILQALEPGIQRRAKEFDLDPEEIAEVRRELFMREVSTRAGTLLLIQSWGTPLCGATGNCAVWVLDSENRMVLETGGNGIRVLRRAHHGPPSILIYTHMSAFQTGLTLYSFDGSQYRQVSCQVETYSDATRTYSPPLIERGPCEK